MDSCEVESGRRSNDESITPNPIQDVAVGTTQLFSHNQIILVPRPTTDGLDPLNLPLWRKWAILILVSAYSSTAVLVATGLGSIFPIIQADYPGQRARTNDLVTYPTLFMGLGNLISMPLALTVGRRPVFLVSLLLMSVSGLWCALSKSLESHIAGRDILALAAGQSEALAPLMIQEIFFLHERGRKLSWFISLQNVVTAGFAMATTYMVEAWGWRWWYGFFTAINVVLLLLSFLLVSETKYDRPETTTSAAMDIVAAAVVFEEDAGTRDEKSGNYAHLEYLRVVTEEEYRKSGNYKPTPWNWRETLKLYTQKPRWSEILLFYKHCAQGVCIPSILWLLLLNGAFLGLYVFQASTFATVLLSPPYNFPFPALGYVQAAQVAVTAVFLPLLGYGGDFIIKHWSKRNKGVYEPEYRLIPLVIPSVVGIICAIMYGQAAANPFQYSHWASVAVSYNATFFGFLGANIVGITYAIDSFPTRAGAFLVVICAGRGFISFGLSYATLPAISAIGYDGVMIAEASICAGLSVLGIAVYFFGRRIRQMADKWFIRS
ncbi:major facilitator superfamily domain-containing protein [Rhexocercosporidium sp. MPI-PUGE-AT-0058]|nr:major facilitator superfamily domain-containing protein [Rhexocercosporidium sp. MPI-PUGE-AT-0058]